MEKIRVLITDHHQLMREGVEAMLQNSADIEVIGLAASGVEASAMTRSIRPDVVLIDVLMPTMNGIEAARSIKEIDQRIKIILITLDINKTYVSEAIKAGVDGYLPKDTSKIILLDAIRSVHRGERYFNDAIKKLVFEDFYATHKTKAVHKTVSSELTKREVEVLALVASGKSNKQMAELLFISVKTVETHKTNMLSKLGLNNSMELILYALKKRIVFLE